MEEQQQNPEQASSGELSTPVKSNHQPIIISLAIGTLVLVFAAGLMAYINYGMSHTPAVEEPVVTTEEPADGEEGLSVEERLELLKSLEDGEGDSLSIEERAALLESLAEESDAPELSNEERLKILESLANQSDDEVMTVENEEPLSSEQPEDVFDYVDEDVANDVGDIEMIEAEPFSEELPEESNIEEEPGTGAGE